MARNSKRCSTIGCRKTATQVMTYSFPESRISRERNASPLTAHPTRV